MPPRENVDRRPVAGGVVVRPQLAEELLDAAPRDDAEEVGKVVGFRRFRSARAPRRFGAAHAGRDGIELVGHVDEAKEECLLVLQPRLEAHHAVEALTGQLARAALDEPEMAGELAESRVARPVAPAEPA